ncbi:MAG: hypothetical protein M5R38_02055 [Candidatus Methylomirabilis sp.]|nr:hypothetical protein [Candidatus Methylomirabilis sp.]
MDGESHQSLDADGQAGPGMSDRPDQLRGIYHISQEPFNPVKNDLTFREIPKTADLAELRISHYSRNARDVKDLNTIFPLERFRELEAQGRIDALASIAFTFMGRIFTRTRLQKEMAPHLIGRLRELRTDAALLVPV